MRKLLLIVSLLLLVFIFSSCGNGEQTYTDDYNRETDYQIEYDTYTSRVTASEQGYYFLSGHIIYYMDKDGDTPVILDGRPNHECLSETNFKNCNAFVSLPSLDASLFQFYDDKLYTIEYRFYDQEELQEAPAFISGEYELVSRMPNGEERKVDYVFPNAEIDKAAIHRGYLYYTANDFGLDEDDDMDANMKLLRLSLKDLKAEPEVIFSAEEGQIAHFIPYGSQVYFTYSPDNLSEMSSEKRYDLNSKEVEDLWANEGKEDAYPTLLGVFEDTLYYKYVKHVTTNDLSHLLDEEYITIHASDLDGGNQRETDIPISEVTTFPYFDRNYLYVEASPTDIDVLSIWEDIELEYGGIEVYQDQQLVYTITKPEYLRTHHAFFPGDDQYMFIYDTDDDDMAFMMYLDKREISSGKAQFKKFIETPEMFDQVNNSSY